VTEIRSAANGFDVLLYSNEYFRSEFNCWSPQIDNSILATTLISTFTFLTYCIWHAAKRFALFCSIHRGSLTAAELGELSPKNESLWQLQG